MCQITDEQPNSVIIVSHIMGGVVAYQLTEHRPDKIHKLIHLAAFLLQGGETLLQHGGAYKTSLLYPNLTFSEDFSFSTVNEKALNDIFYSDCSELDIEFARSCICPQAGSPPITPVTITDENFYLLRLIFQIP